MDALFGLEKCCKLAQIVLSKLLVNMWAWFWRTHGCLGHRLEVKNYPYWHWLHIYIYIHCIYWLGLGRSSWNVNYSTVNHYATSEMRYIFVCGSYISQSIYVTVFLCTVPTYIYCLTNLSMSDFDFLPPTKVPPGVVQILLCYSANTTSILSRWSCVGCWLWDCGKHTLLFDWCQSCFRGDGEKPLRQVWFIPVISTGCAWYPPEN